MSKRNQTPAVPAAPAPQPTNNAAPVRKEPRVTEWSVSDDDPQTSASPVSAIKESSAEQDRLDRIKAKLSGETPTEETPTEEVPEVETQGEETDQTGDEIPKVDEIPAETPKPTRRDMMATIKAERERLGIEQTLKQERAKREELEKLVKQGSVLQLLQQRGVTREQALEEMLLNPEEQATSEQPATPRDPRVDQMEREIGQLRQERQTTQEREALRLAETLTSELDIPLVRAAKVVPVPTNDGGIRQVSPFRLVLETAAYLAQQAGDKDNPAVYLQEAAAAVEEQLAEQNKDLLDAYAKKTGRGPATTPTPAPQKPKTVPSLGRKTGGGANKTIPGDNLSLDREERAEQLKARLGW